VEGCCEALVHGIGNVLGADQGSGMRALAALRVTSPLPAGTAAARRPALPVRPEALAWCAVRYSEGRRQRPARPLDRMRASRAVPAWQARR
jgi:hypothetical protein